jgi:hypothetical protein
MHPTPPPFFFFLVFFRDTKQKPSQLLLSLPNLFFLIPSFRMACKGQAKQKNSSRESSVLCRYIRHHFTFVGLFLTFLVPTCFFSPPNLPTYTAYLPGSGRVVSAGPATLTGPGSSQPPHQLDTVSASGPGSSDHPEKGRAELKLLIGTKLS